MNDHCPICGKVYTENNFRVNYHVKYKPDITTYACRSCNYAERLWRRRVRITNTRYMMWNKLKKVKAWTRRILGLLPSIHLDRARAVIINKDRILLIERNRSGDIYYVLPGGKIEDNESPEVTVLREIKEETSVEVKITQKLNTVVDKEGTIHHIYFCEYISGTPSLSPDSPELTKESGIDVYTPMWMEINKIKEIPMWPAEVKVLLTNYFKL